MRAVVALIAAGAVAALVGASRVSAGTVCTGDCGSDGLVTVDEIVVAVRLALEGGSTEACANADVDGSGGVTVDEVVAAVNFALSGCPAVVAPTPTATAPAEPSATPTPAATAGADVPIGGAQLRPWLQAGNYVGWRAESALHPSGGPHLTDVRTFVNDVLFESLSAGNAVHPRGAAAVKELYGAAAVLRGWAVSVKVADDSDGGSGWYWYERVDSGVFADGNGAAVCTSCHRDAFRGFDSKDFILIPFPLQ